MKIKALEENRKQLIFELDELVNERRFEINKLSKRIDFNYLTSYFTGKSAPKYFLCFKGPLIIYSDIKNSRINLQKEKKFKKNFDYS